MSFFRKKTPKPSAEDDRPTTSAPTLPPVSTASPLYAKFTSTSGVSGPVRLVSSPMALGPGRTSPTKLTKRGPVGDFAKKQGPIIGVPMAAQGRPYDISNFNGVQQPPSNSFNKPLPVGPDPAALQSRRTTRRESQPVPARSEQQQYPVPVRSPSHAAPSRAEFKPTRQTEPRPPMAQLKYHNQQQQYPQQQPPLPSSTSRGASRDPVQPRAHSRPPHPPPAHDFYQQPILPPARPPSRQEVHRSSSRQEIQRPSSRQEIQRPSSHQEGFIARAPSRQDIRETNTQERMSSRPPHQERQQPGSYHYPNTVPSAPYHEPRGFHLQQDGQIYARHEQDDGSQFQPPRADANRQSSRSGYPQPDTTHIQRSPSVQPRPPHPPSIQRTPSRQANNHTQYDVNGSVPTSQSAYRPPLLPQEPSHLPSPPSNLDNDMGHSYMSAYAPPSPMSPAVAVSRAVSQRTPSRGKPLIFAAMNTVDDPVPAAHSQQPYAPTPSQPTQRQQQQQSYPIQQAYPTPPLSYDTMSDAYRANLAGAAVPAQPPTRSNSAVLPPSPSTNRKQKRTSQLPEIPHSNTQSSTPRALTKTKSRPTTPVSMDKRQKRKSSVPSTTTDEAVEPMLDLGEDPFAKADVVRVAGRSGTSSDGGHEPSSSSQPQTPKRVFQSPPTPVSPAEYQQARSQRRGDKLGAAVPPLVSEVIARQKRPFPLAQFLEEPRFLSAILTYGAFTEYALLASVSKRIRIMFNENRDVRETLMERFIPGYKRWGRDERAEPFSLSTRDLHDYMRGVCIPDNQYARHAAESLSQRMANPELDQLILDLAAATRAYTRVVLRIRAQAEAEEKEFIAAKVNATPPPPSSSRMNMSGTPSRPASPTFSHISHSHHGHGNGNTRPRPSPQATQSFQWNSPLFRPRRAPLLRVFVPSPGDWLSDAGVLACEEELRRAGVLKSLRVGDVVWDMAIGDEGNVGRMVWDGQFLIDLDYTWTAVGDLPQYLHTLAFPPSYFHRVIRTGPVSNPIVHMDISPWGDEIALNLQLLQDRVRTETPQGSYHNLVRWVHRSSFAVQLLRNGPPRIPIPGSESFVDPGWHGTVVVEAEGTNEGLADLQDRCGPAVFPPRPQGILPKPAGSERVFRILREKSRPGEIWLRTVRAKERIQI